MPSVSSCGSLATQSAQARTSTESIPLSASVFNAIPSTRWCLVPSIMCLCKSLTLLASRPSGVRVGHMSGTTAGSTEEDQSKVMKQHLRTKSSRFLLSKEEVLAGYIQENKRAYGQLASSFFCFLVFTCRLCMYSHTPGPVIYPLSIKH
jgi:hypothetical protein